MKVDTNRIQEAYLLLNALRQRLKVIESSVEQVQRNLSRLQFGSQANTAAIVGSLLAQRKVLCERIAGMERMVRVLEAAAGQYSTCEGQAEMIAYLRGVVSVVKRFDIPAQVLPNRFIAHGLETETIERYIRPLMAGKKGTL